MTKDDIAIIARCIAVANNHPAPDDYVAAVVGAFDPAILVASLYGFASVTGAPVEPGVFSADVDPSISV